MERKTKVHAENDRHDLLITREFELPVELLFRAHVDKEIFEEWMTHDHGIVKVLKMEARKHGGWQFHTSDKQGNVVFSANGVFHDVVQDRKIVRTFEIENSPMEVQFEYLEFEKLTDDTSRLKMQSIFRSVALRDQMLKVPFAPGLDMAHNRLQKVLSKLK